MAHGYKALQNWNEWLAEQFLGNSVLEEEKQGLSVLLRQHYGKHALLIGVPHQATLLTSLDLPCHTLISPMLGRHHPIGTIESDFHELPIMTGSIDLVILPHTLEFVDNPRHLLSEACRIVKPEGLIAICGFNPYSTWNLRHYPWSSNFIQPRKIKAWLRLAYFMMEQQRSLLFRPPVNHQVIYNKLHFMENLFRKCCPMIGGAYILLARAKVVPLTPIRMKWTQQLSGIRISTTMTGHIARHSK